MLHPTLLMQELIQFDSLVTVNAVIASVCLAVALGVGALLLYRIWAGGCTWHLALAAWPEPAPGFVVGLGW